MLKAMRKNKIAANRYLKENGITDIDSLTEEQKQEIILGYADKYIWGDEVVENNNSNDDKKISEWVNDIKIHKINPTGFAKKCALILTMA